MATLREVRSRIAGVKKTQKITKAMKMVAAAKLRRAQNAVVSARPYAAKMKEVLQRLAAQAGEGRSPLLGDREVRSVALVVVTADRGLCGAFNSNLMRAAVSHLETQYKGWNAQGKIKVFCVGKRGSDFFSKRQFTVAGKRVGLFDRLSVGDAQGVARDIIGGYERGDYDRVEVIYNAFKSIARQEIVIEQFLPVPPGTLNGGGVAGAHRMDEYIYEPSGSQLLQLMLPKHLYFQVWRILLESNAAEQGARMAAMENATSNADEMIQTLQLQYNKARQASITKELLEVVSGAEALTEAT
jgi:F-type H+-transporting ATPase subunit gamma